MGTGRKSNNVNQSFEIDIAGQKNKYQKLQVELTDTHVYYSVNLLLTPFAEFEMLHFEPLQALQLYSRLLQSLDSEKLSYKGL
jgi:hypothetical protein